MKKIVILISGRGSNMEAIIRARDAGECPVDIAAVISNKADAKGLETAQKAGIATRVLDHKGFAGREAFDGELAALIDGFQPDLVVLAGFMRILSAGFVQHYVNRLLNIHPSLLPAFTGLHTHQRALDEGVRVHGCTVHFVTAELDHGPVVLQAAVPVLDDDDEDALSARVLRQEHRIYPLAVRWFAEDRLRIENGKVRVNAPLEGEDSLVSPTLH